MTVPTIPNPNNPKAIEIVDLLGGESYMMPVTIAAGNNIEADGMTVTGLNLTTAGVSDSTDKNFVTDAELDYLEAQTPLGGAETLLISKTGVDLNSDSEQSLYTVPGGKSCIPTRFVVRAASTSLTTASWSIGFNAGTDNDVVANATHTELTGSTLYTVLSAKAGAKRGAAADVLALKNNTKQGGAATVTIDVFGYLY